MPKKFFIQQIAFVFALVFFTSNNIKAFSSINLDSEISKLTEQDVIRLIKEQGSKSNYYLGQLSFQMVNVDNDDDLEVIAQTYGGVHLGDFFIFDRNKNGKYSLAVEREWRVEKYDFADSPNLIGGIKLNGLIECTGGSGLDIHTAHLWYLKEGKFIEAWQGILYERSFFQGELYITPGGYQYNDDFYKLYYWSSKYSIKVDTNTPTKKPVTSVSIYKFDGTKFIKEAEQECEHTNVYPTIKSK